MLRPCLSVSSYILVVSDPKEMFELGFIWLAYCKNTVNLKEFYPVCRAFRYKPSDVSEEHAASIFRVET
jgi:hypothetical protein